MSITTQAVLCGSIAFTINTSLDNGKLQQGYAMIQNGNLQILSDGNSWTFNLTTLISLNPKDIYLDNVSKCKYGLNALFQQSDCQVCDEVDLYTDNESLHDTFYQCFSDILMEKDDDKQPSDDHDSDQDNKDDDKHQESQPLLEEEKKLEVALYEIACEGLCSSKYCAKQLYFCGHKRCLNVNDQQKLLCAECGLFSHKKKSHPFYTDKEYIVCVQDLMNPDDKKFQSGQKAGKLLQRGIKSVEQILFRQRWLLNISRTNIIPVAAYAEGSKVIYLAFGATAVSSGICTVIGTAIEWIYIGQQLYKERISREEAIKLGVTAFVANGLSVGTYFGVMAIGAALGTPAGPVGVIIGAVIAAAVVGLGTRYAVNKGCENIYLKKKHSERAELQKEALKFFFNNKKFDIADKTKFNEKILKRTYHRLAVIYHPDRKDGDHSEWLKLSAYYGILIALIEQQIEDEQQNEIAEIIESVHSINIQ